MSQCHFVQALLLSEIFWSWKWSSGISHEGRQIGSSTLIMTNEQTDGYLQSYIPFSGGHDRRPSIGRFGESLTRISCCKWKTIIIITNLRSVIIKLTLSLRLAVKFDTKRPLYCHCFYVIGPWSSQVLHDYWHWKSRNKWYSCF